MNIQAQHLIEKWAPVLDHESMPKISDPWRRTVTAMMLENQESSNREAKNATGGILTESSAHDVDSGAMQGYDPVLISMVRRSMPQLIAYDVMGVQPMNMPTGLIFAMRARYNDASPDIESGTEALYNEPDSAFSGTGTQTDGTGPNDPTYDTGTAMSTAAGEALVGATDIAEMGFSIEKVSIAAKSRKLKAQYTVELAQDLKNVHGLDAESELANILSTEILAEINREAIRTLYIAASQGSALTTSAGTFDLDVDSNGRWSAEKFKGLMFNIDRDANAIARQTRRGKGNVLICSSDVASALQMAGVLDYTPAIQNQLEVDDAGSTFAGVANGRIKVYIDPYWNGTNNYYVVGYKGTNAFDAGMFYAPYVPLQMSRAMGEDSFQPKISFMTRYGMTGNPFAYVAEGAQDREIDPLNVTYAGNNVYYKKSVVTNVM